MVASEMTVRVFLAPHLVAMRDRFEVTVVVNTSNPWLLDELGVDARFQRVAIVRPIAVWSDLRASWHLFWFLRLGRFDLVHSMTPKAGLIAMMTSWLAGVPVRLHTFTGQVWATRQGLARSVLRLVDTIVARAATFTLTDSLSQREFLIEQGVVPACKVSVLGRGSVCGVDEERFRPQPACRATLREQLRLSPENVVLLFVGRLNRDKGVQDLARAFAMLADERPDVCLLVVGPDEENMQPVMRAECGRHVSRVRFLQFTTAPQDIMAAADVLCLPSYREGFGSVVIEAAAVGLPAVASRICGLVDAVVEERTGLLHMPGDVDDLLCQLRRVVCDAPFRRALGEAARRRAAEDFPQSRLTAAAVDLYQGLLDGRSPLTMGSSSHDPSLEPARLGGSK